MEKLKERLTILLGKEKLLSKPHRENNSYLEMQKNNNLSLKQTQLNVYLNLRKVKSLFFQHIILTLNLRPTTLLMLAISLTLPVPHKIDSYWLAILMLKIPKKLCKLCKHCKRQNLFKSLDNPSCIDLFITSPL